eukprot:403166_1
MANANTVVQTQPSINSLPPGWRTLQTNYGETYYQNNITKQTQWERPYHLQSISSSAHTTTPQKQTTKKIENTTNTYKRTKWWNKEYILCFILIIVGIYDFITDLQVVSLWIFKSNGDHCKQFRCNLVNSDLIKQCALILFTCSSVGFVVGVSLKLYGTRKHYLMYKYPITEQDILDNGAENAKISLLFGWIPLILEDVMSVFLMFVVSMPEYGGLHDHRLHTAYYQSMFASGISLILQYILSFGKTWKLKKHKKK